MALYKGEDKIKDIYLGDVPIFKVYAGEEFCGFFTFSHENLISNSDFSNGTTGWTATTGTIFNVLNGNAFITMALQYGNIYQSTPNVSVGDIIYFYANIKSDTNLSCITINNPTTSIYHPGDNQYHLLSRIITKNAVSNAIYFYQIKTSDWTPIEVDYVGVINITDLVYRGILPSGLTNLQYKDILDAYFNS